MSGVNLQACFPKISFEYLLALEISKGFQIFIVIYIIYMKYMSDQILAANFSFTS